MLHRLLVICAIVIPATAHADPLADLTTVVRTHVTALASGNDADYAGSLAPAAFVVGPDGNVVTPPTVAAGCKKSCGAASRNILYSGADGKATHQLGKLVGAVDGIHHVAWFQAPFQATFKTTAGANPCGGGPATAATLAMRISGIAIDDHGWKLVAVMYTRPMPDATLLAQPGGRPHTGAPAVTGDSALATAVAGWFPDKLTAARTTGTTVMASGTAPSEYAVGAAASKLTAAWDKLKLVVAAADAHLFADGALGFVRVETEFPATQGGGVALILGAIVVREGDSWRWVSLQFTPGFTPM